jgi:hypothetical protein
MSDQEERHAIRHDLDSVFRTQTSPQDGPLSQLTTHELIEVRNIAARIISGDVDRDELSALGDPVGSAVAEAVRRLMSLRESRQVLDLQLKNPYYSVSQPRIVRESATDFDFE